jgi:hypothetical protein
MTFTFEKIFEFLAYYFGIHPVYPILLVEKSVAKLDIFDNFAPLQKFGVSE